MEVTIYCPFLYEFISRNSQIITSLFVRATNISRIIRGPLDLIFFTVDNTERCFIRAYSQDQNMDLWRQEFTDLLQTFRFSEIRGVAASHFLIPYYYNERYLVRDYLNLSRVSFLQGEWGDINERFISPLDRGGLFSRGSSIVLERRTGIEGNCRALNVLAGMDVSRLTNNTDLLPTRMITLLNLEVILFSAYNEASLLLFLNIPYTLSLIDYNWFTNTNINERREALLLNL